MSKKKILLLSDDLRMHSGIATMSRELVLGTVHHYDWIQLGAALQHPDAGKAYDLSVDIARETGVEDASVKLIAWNGYGDRNILFSILQQEKPDAIFHFTEIIQFLNLMTHSIQKSDQLNAWGGEKGGIVGFRQF